jgi:hypothetical protein
MIDTLGTLIAKLGTMVDTLGTSIDKLGTMIDVLGSMIWTNNYSIYFIKTCRLSILIIDLFRSLSIFTSFLFQI